MIREGATVVIAGRTNVGKSSVFNRLTGVDRAIVTAIPGTTRDLVTETVDIEGIAVSLVDTAGWRDTHDIVEREGVERGSHARGVADLILLVLDQSDAIAAEDARLLDETARSKRIVVLNKSDLVARIDESRLGAPIARVSALTGHGFDGLRRMMARELTGGEQLRDRGADFKHAARAAARGLPRVARSGAHGGGSRKRAGRISADRSAGRQGAARRDRRPAHERRRAAPHLRALLHRKVRVK